MERKYNITLDDSLKEEVNSMASLGEDTYRHGIRVGKAEGIAEGRAEGIAEGRAEREREIARNIKAKGVPLETIAICTGLSIEEIEKL